MVLVAMRGGNVVYVTTRETEAEAVSHVRLRIAAGHPPVGLRHDPDCGFWRGDRCRCRTRVARMETLDGVLEVKRSSPWGYRP